MCNIDGTEFEVTVPGNSVEKLSVGDKFFVGVNDGALGLKYFHVIFDENYYVATEIPQKIRCLQYDTNYISLCRYQDNNY